MRRPNCLLLCFTALLVALILSWRYEVVASPRGYIKVNVLTGQAWDYDGEYWREITPEPAPES